MSQQQEKYDNNSGNPLDSRRTDGNEYIGTYLV